MENERENTVCRFCFSSWEQGFQDVNVVSVEMLRFLNLDLHLDLSRKSVICKTCSENIQKCFEFKTILACTEDRINSFRNDTNNVKLDLRDIYLRKNEIKNIDLSICRLCLKITESGCWMSLNDDAKDVISAKAILRRYFPQLDLDITKDSEICASCNDFLHIYFTFVKNCVDVKNEIKTWRKIEGSNNGNQVESNNELQLGAKNLSNNKTGYPDIDIYKNCNENELYVETGLKIENIKQEESQEKQVKREVIEYAEIDDVKVEKLGDLVEKLFDKQQDDGNKLMCKNIVETDNRGIIKYEEIDIKTEEEDIDGFQNNMFIHKNPSEVTLYSCEKCTHKTKRKGNLDKHMLIHKNISEITMYSCAICTYKGKQKKYLKEHMLIHKNISEVMMHSCEICTYKSKHKNNLNKHMLIHKSNSEVTMFSCEICTYKAKRKISLQTHMLIHKKTSEVTMYSCEICAYKSKRENCLKRHMLIHKSTTEVTMYSCDICTYTAKRKSNLKRHMLIHKIASEVRVHSSEICTSKAQCKSTVKQHMLIHKKPSEVAYFCEICTYKAKQKRNLKQHMLIHKNSSDVTIYSCELCTYKSVHKSSFKRHMLIHKSTSEITMYSCEICTYKARQQNNLKTHMLVHKNTSEVTMHSCEICTYKAKHKSSLKRHIMLIHKDASETTVCSCEMCKIKQNGKAT